MSATVAYSAGMGNPHPETRLLTVREAADKLSVSHDTVYRMIHAGELEAVRRPDRRGTWQVREDSVLNKLHRSTS